MTGTVKTDIDDLASATYEAIIAYCTGSNNKYNAKATYIPYQIITCKYLLENTGYILNANMLINSLSEAGTFKATRERVLDYFDYSGFENVIVKEASSTKAIGTILSISVGGNSKYESARYNKNIKIVVEVCAIKLD